MKKSLTCMLLVLTMLLALISGCGSNAASTVANSADASSAEQTGTEETDSPEEATVEDISSATEPQASAEETDYGFDFTAHLELMKDLHSELPIVDEPVTLTYWDSGETASYTHIKDQNMQNHQVFVEAEKLTGVHLDITLVDSNSEAEKFQLMLASNDLPDIFSARHYINVGSSVVNAYEQDQIIALTDLISEYAPNYTAIIDQPGYNLREEVTANNGEILDFYTIRDTVANPNKKGTFIRMDWLEDLGMDVPQTYDELFDVLTAFKTEKGAVEPMQLYQTIVPENGTLIGGFGSNAVLSPDTFGNSVSGYRNCAGGI